MKKPFQHGDQKNQFDGNPKKGGRGEDMTGPLDVPKKGQRGVNIPVKNPDGRSPHGH